MVDTKLLELICCPIGKAALKFENDSIICSKCGVIFPVTDGIPSLIIEEAKLPGVINSISELNCQKEKDK